MNDVPIIVPHEEHGDAECCGCLMPIMRGDQADLVCNECGAVVGTVAASEVEHTLLQMAMAAGMCNEVCPICGGLNTFLGFTAMESYICRHCSEGVVVRRSVQ